MVKLKLYIAEDDHEDWFLMKSLLDNKPEIQYKRFVSGVSLLEQLPFLDSPDLILLDWRMPVLSGLEVLQKLKNSSHRHIPVIIMTTTQQESDIYNAYYNGASSYIPKPIDEQGFDLFVKYWTNLSKLPTKNAA